MWARKARRKDEKRQKKQEKVISTNVTERVALICITNITCERSQRSGPIHPTLKRVQFTNPFSSASP